MQHYALFGALLCGTVPEGVHVGGVYFATRLFAK